MHRRGQWDKSRWPAVDVPEVLADRVDLAVTITVVAAAAGVLALAVVAVDRRRAKLEGMSGNAIGQSLEGGPIAFEGRLSLEPIN